MLYIISTPIGNIEDISLRAIRILKEVDTIICEDTRRTSKLLKHYEIPKKRFIVYNDYNKKKVIPKIIELLKTESIAFVSDNGTPCISDPGYNIIKECIANNIKVSPVPGANAMLTGLVCSGLPTDKFIFYGFLPKTSGKKQRTLEEMKNNTFTSIFYESPHRINKTLKVMNEIMPDRQIVIARELTKKFEEFLRGKVSELTNKTIKLKGEIVVIINKK